jgi:predicted kinase
MCGIPGAGKSTWINSRNNGICISRDAIRFSLLQEGDDYFAYEDIVVKRFWEAADAAINGDAENIYIDATHLSPKARRQVLSNLALDKVDNVIAVSFEVPLEVAFERNGKRKGRARVPRSAIYNMFKAYRPPTFAETYFTEIIHVDANGVERKEKRRE